MRAALHCSTTTLPSGRGRAASGSTPLDVFNFGALSWAERRKLRRGDELKMGRTLKSVNPGWWLCVSRSPPYWVMAQIRRITPDDWQLLRDTRLAALADAPYAFGSTFAEEVILDEAQWRKRAETLAWFVAVEDDEGVGVAAGMRLSPPAHDLVAMWTHPKMRATGTADALVGAVVDWARADGASQLRLWVADGNERASAFYHRLGFVSTGVRERLRSNPAVGETQLALKL